MNQAEKQLEVLNEAVKHFNMTNRSIVRMRCVYSPSKNSEGCGVGRLIDDKELCKEFDDRDAKVSLIFEELPLKVQQLGVEFLSELQHLHDTEQFWDEKGLSEYGKGYVKRMKKDIRADKLTGSNY